VEGVIAAGKKFNQQKAFFVISGDKGLYLGGAQKHGSLKGETHPPSQLTAL
jgi:hypothetical protein